MNKCPGGQQWRAASDIMAVDRACADIQEREAIGASLANFPPPKVPMAATSTPLTRHCEAVHSLFWPATSDIQMAG